MKNRAKETPPTALIAGEREEDDEEAAASRSILQCGGDGSDPCKSLMDRYGASAAPQHRHLCAAASAMRSILLEEGLPITSPAYFAAAITALRESDRTDTTAAAALVAFLSILLPLLPSHSLPPQKAKDAALVLTSFLKDPESRASTGTVRSVIKSLGFLALRVDLEDWSAIELPIDLLLMFSVDRRPKVRRCAQVCIEKVCKALQNSVVIKKASKAVLCMYKKYISTAKEISRSELSDAPQGRVISEPGNMEILHMLNVVKLVIRKLSDTVKAKIFSNVLKRLDSSFSEFTRPILGLVEGLLEHSEAQVLIPEADNFFSTLTSYVSFGKKNPADTVISALTLLKDGLNKLCDSQRTMWVKNLPLIVTSVTGLLNSDANTSKHAAGILKELIVIHIDQDVLHAIASEPGSNENLAAPDTVAIKSICTEFYNMLSTSKIPSEHVLAVISVLFLKLGVLSNVFLKEIVLRLSQLAICGDEEISNMKHLEECIGAAVTAMGPEKILSLIPISLHTEMVTCSNAWLIPILEKYVVGASLQYFMEHVVPLAKTIHNACSKVKKTQLRNNLQACAYSLWNLLPAFCRYPTDISLSFDSLADLMIVVLKEDPTLHETILIALQELVNENLSILGSKLPGKECVDPPTFFAFEGFHSELKSSPFHYSKKNASRNIKAMASSSNYLFQTLTDIFFDSSPKKRTYLKGAIRCLASVVGTEYLQTFFLSLTEKSKSVDDMDEPGILEDRIQEPDINDVKKATKKEEPEDKRCLLMELASCFTVAADADLISLIFDYIKRSLMATSEIGQPEAYYALSTILKEHCQFLLSRIDDVIEMLLSIKPAVDSAVLQKRLSCFHYLLISMLKRNEEKMDAKAFLILNEIILKLKSKKESRKLAYDLLLSISCSLKNSDSDKAESDLLRLFNMVMGYLSSPSSHITSGAVCALSLLIYKDAKFCLCVPNLIPSILVLLQNKDNEITKAALGFIKVLVSSLETADLSQLLSDVVKGILPWSEVSKFHFRSKVSLIVEILARKCGSDAVYQAVPSKYRRFVRNVIEARQSKKNPKGDVNQDAAAQSAESVVGRKRVLEDGPGPVEKHTKAAFRIHKQKRRKENEKNMSLTNNASLPDGKVVNDQFSRSANTSKSKSLSQNKLSSTGRNKRGNIDNKTRVRNRTSSQMKKDVNSANNTASFSESVATSKFNRRKRPFKS